MATLKALIETLWLTLGVQIICTAMDRAFSAEALAVAIAFRAIVIHHQKENNK